MTREEAHDIIENKLRCEEIWNTNRCHAECKECPYFSDYDTTIKAYGVVIKVLELIPDNATNGDIIKALCGDIKVIENKEFMLMTFPKDWWNSPYERG